MSRLDWQCASPDVICHPSLAFSDGSTTRQWPPLFSRSIGLHLCRSAALTRSRQRCRIKTSG